MIRNLAVYWDEILYPSYNGDEAVSSEDPLVTHGVFRSLEREVPAHQMFPGREGFDPTKKWVYTATEAEDGTLRVELDSAEEEGSTFSSEAPLGELSDPEIELLAAIDFEEHLGYVDDALAIASSNNLAPISHSLGGHLGAVVGSSAASQDAIPLSEAALLSVVIDAFAIDPSVSSDDILLFRERNRSAQSRLRASLVDLAADLQGERSPEALLAQARDTYKNRIEPALGALEDALNESRIRFFLKSLLGATAIVTAPIEPVSTSVGVARVMGHSIDYSYSKSRLVREHPYGYLHEVRRDLGSRSNGGFAPDVEQAMMSPREFLRELWRQYWFSVRDFDKDRSS